jgi:hypothetical protein
MEVAGRISGFETYEQVLSTLAALQRERANPRSEGHAEAVVAQIAIFESEAARMEAIIAEHIEKENAARYSHLLGHRLPDAVAEAAAGGKPKRRKKAS